MPKRQDQEIKVEINLTPGHQEKFTRLVYELYEKVEKRKREEKEKQQLA